MILIPDVSRFELLFRWVDVLRFCHGMETTMLGVSSCESQVDMSLGAPWRIIPVSKLLTMVIVSHSRIGLFPFQMAMKMAYTWG